MARKKRNVKLPSGWDEAKLRRVLDHYENQSQKAAAEEDETAFARPSHTLMKVPRKLVSTVRQLIALDKE